MARTMKDAKLQTRAARGRLRPQRKPHWCTLRPGLLHLGYCRTKPSKPGHWTVRRYLGNPTSPYKETRLPGVADDFEDANGVSVLSFVQAQDLALAPVAPEQHGPLTVANAIDAYVNFLRDSGREQPAVETKRRLQNHVVPQLGDVEVAALTAEQLRSWLATVAKKAAKGTDDDAVRRSQASANRVWNSFRAALTLAYIENKVASDSAWRRVSPFKNVEVARKRYLTIEQSQRLINGAEPPFRYMVQAGLHTGARYSELARLRVHDFDPDSGTIGIAKSKTSKPRRVHLTEEGEAFFRKITIGRRGDEFLFQRLPGEPWRTGDQQFRMYGAVKRARITPTISFHGLRHTYASLSLMGGVPLQVVAEALGHTTTRMTELHYGHLTASHKRDAIRAGAPRFGVVEAEGAVVPLKR